MINFYYDKITKQGPVPNGLPSYVYNKSAFSYPYSIQPLLPVKPICDFWITSIRNEAEPVLYTKNQSVDNLFYPIEIKQRYSHLSLLDLIPKKTLKRFLEGNLKPLFLAQSLKGLGQLDWAKKHIDAFINYGINPSNIKVVIGDVNNSYKRYFAPCSTFTFDWWQVEAQQLLRGNDDKYRAIQDRPAGYLYKHNIPTQLFSLENKKDSIHGVTLVSELILRNYKSNITSPIYNQKYDWSDSRIYDKFRDEHKNYNKKQILESIMSKGINCNLENAQVKILIQEHAGCYNEEYLDEVTSIYTDFELWQAIYNEQPLIVMGSYQIMRYLNQEGYFTWQELINENYDSILEFPQRAEQIVDNIERLSKLDINAAVEKLKPFMKINKEKFLGKSHLARFINLYDRIRND